MKLFLTVLVFTFLLHNNWLTNINEAKTIAQKENKYILLNFSGSDWCGPCIRMHKEIFENEAFSKFADSTLILVNADFPRMKKHQLSAAQQKTNDATAEKYNPNGIFPYTLLLDTNGKVIKAWEGFYEKGAADFTAQVTQLIKIKTLQK